jgi:hypothetical protein
MPGAVNVNLANFSVESVTASAETTQNIDSSSALMLLLVYACSRARSLAQTTERPFTNCFLARHSRPTLTTCNSHLTPSLSCYVNYTAGYCCASVTSSGWRDTRVDKRQRMKLGGSRLVHPAHPLSPELGKGGEATKDRPDRKHSFGTDMLIKKPYSR